MTVRDPHADAPTAEEPARPEPAALAPAALEPAVAACPRCGTPLREEQDWCLHCGAAATSPIASPAGWRAPVAVIAAVLLLAFAGLVVAFLAISDDSDELTRIAAAQEAAPAQATPTPPPPPPAPAPSATPGAQTVPPATTEDGASDLPGLENLPDESREPGAGAGAGPEPGAGGGAPGSAAGGEVGSWPAGRNAFTVVLLSSPSRAGANRRARELAESGTEVGVLRSDDFESLRRGFFVVFSGQYDSRKAAEDALEDLSGDAPGAYVRRVTPR